MIKKCMLGSVCVFALLQIFSSCRKNEIVMLRFQNPLLIARNNEVVTISYHDFANQAGDLPAGSLPLFLDGEDTLTSQNIDLNKDGIPEEILVEISLSPSGKKDIRTEFIPGELFPVFPEKTNLHFAKLLTPGAEIDSASRLGTTDSRVTASVFQMEGPGWENDKVAFRNYYDLRNGMDIFGKKLNILVLDTIGIGKNSIHQMGRWGMDILAVGSSMGAGSIGLEKDGVLYRIGDNGQSGYERTYEGPLRSEFALHFANWKANEKSFNIIHYISITAGLYRYESEVFADFPDSSYQLFTGMENKSTESAYFDDAGEKHVLLGNHSTQAEDTAELGLAILVPGDLYISKGESPKTGKGIIESDFVRISTNMNEPARFYIYAGWATANRLFDKKEDFIRFIKDDALKIENPIHIEKIILP